MKKKENIKGDVNENDACDSRKGGRECLTEEWHFVREKNVVLKET